MATTPAPDAASQPPASHPAKRNGLGTAALVIGVVSLVLAVLVIFAPLALPLGLLAIVFGAFGMARASRGEADNNGHAVAGMVTGGLSIVVAIILGITFVNSLVKHQDDLRRFGTCLSGADDDDERGACIRELGDRLEDG